MTDVFIYDHLRTPRGKGRPDGALHEVPPIQLVTQTLQAIRDRNELDTALLDDVVIGCAQPVSEQGGVLARAAVLNAGYAESVAGQQIHRFCASGLEAVNNVASQIASGMAQAGIGGGVESMSRIKMGYDTGAWAADPWVAFHNHYAPQGIGADIIATLEGYSRTDVDGYAAESQRRAAQAWDEGRFDRSIMPVKDVMGEVILTHDEHRRPGTTVESLGSLKAAFAGPAAMGYARIAKERYPQIEEINHVHTGGNSSGIVDGAGVVLMGSAEYGEAAGLKPRARFKGWATIGSEPTIMLTAPVAVAEKALRLAGMTRADIDLWELNEAFASVVLRAIDKLELDPAKVNVNGGAIALGHPLGMSGARITLSLALELKRRGGGIGAAALCGGGGQGSALILRVPA